MKNLKLKSCYFVFLLLFLGISFQSVAQEEKASDTISDGGLTADQKAAIQANNPLASIKTFNMHNYYNPSLEGLPDATSNTFWFRYAQPVGNFLIRASMPISSVPGGVDQTNKSGLGDLNAFATYLAVKNAKTTFGVGPLVVAPTATDELLGSGKWQGGIALIIFEVLSKQFQVGGLITWQASFAGQSDRENTNVMAVQAFGMWQLGGGTYLRSSAVSTFNFKQGTYLVPFGLGLGKVLKAEGLVFNIFAEPQFSVLSYGVGQPKIQLFFGINTQF